MTQSRTDRCRLMRTGLREARRGLPAPQRIAGAEQVAAHLLDLPFAPVSGYVAGYWAMDGEIGLHAWQLRLPPGCIYCLPVLHGDLLRFAPWRPGDALVTNRYGIPEPALEPESALPADAMSLVVVPLVGFDAAGDRLGMGGGWYDRSFAFRRERPAPPWLVGAAFGLQQVERVPVADWDVGLDAVCTEASTHLFRE
ncbi:5-formyltetrahydrofolate cyclo-ligase [Lysobacter sp. GX 14042]|uniref:5-formyltetrahydrofolate cyclo-ligase n=1 Tax=Lysobacter sp. GX 14042 TaxID=2907155 RepID=UPI001F258AA2|nr:5-formyltetrahydrofolate cyclo-ligase [Lysobacter sp. GX 14042]MCE7033492.1 5-formyltetrahydrofolate cyclo-ligase [Lysobacter sp. GX 14042]